MIGAGLSFALQVVLQVALLAGSFTNIGHVAVLVNVSNDSDPCFSSCGAVGVGIKPAVCYAGNQGESEHGGARTLWPRLVMVDELAPHAIFPLVLEQRRHHGPVPSHNARTLR